MAPPPSARSSAAPWEVGIISCETFCKIQDYHQHRGLTVAQIARELGLDPKTVVKWIQEKNYWPRTALPRSSKLDPFKRRVVGLLERHPYSVTQVFQRLREEGYGGGFSILKDYVRKVRKIAQTRRSDPVLRTRRVRPGRLG
ncbi:MAG: terminase gpP N-terminus-related DNA-binding protein [Methylococcales bacterium]